MKFSSRDRDNDLSSGNCAHYVGGWWHNNCGAMEINDNSGSPFIIIINGAWHAPELLEIKIRPRDCNKND